MYLYSHTCTVKFDPLPIPTFCLQRPPFWSPNFGFCDTNNHLSTTTTMSGSQRGSLYTCLAILVILNLVEDLVSSRHCSFNRSQYHFNCDCVPCTEKEFQEFEERFSALKCHFCDGPIKNPSSENSLEHSLPCYDCGKEQVFHLKIIKPLVWKRNPLMFLYIWLIQPWTTVLGYARKCL